MAGLWGFHVKRGGVAASCLARTGVAKAGPSLLMPGPWRRVWGAAGQLILGYQKSLPGRTPHSRRWAWLIQACHPHGGCRVRVRGVGRFLRTPAA